jgi:hypothetical protein
MVTLGCRVARVHVGGQLPSPGLTASEVGLVGQLVCLLVGLLVWAGPGWVVCLTQSVCWLVGWLVGLVCRLGPLFPSVHPNLGLTQHNVLTQPV